MENNQVIMMKEKLGFFGIIKQSLKIIPKKPKFIILTLLTSFPLFIFSLFLEFHLQQSFTKISNLITSPTDDYPFDSGIYIYRSQYYWSPTDSIRNFIQGFWKPFLFPILLYLGIGHVLDLINTVTIIHSASKIYGGQDKETLSLKEMLKKVRAFKGPLVTSIYVLILSSLTWIGFLSILMHYFMMDSFNGSIVLKVFFVLAFLGLLTKSMEWSGIWNVGMVISVLEEKHGDVAIGVSAYISRGSRRRGCLLMFVFFAWKVLLRLICFYGDFVRERKCMVVFTVGLVCAANVVKWVVFTVYFYDCKKRFLEKKADVEQGTQAQVS